MPVKQRLACARLVRRLLSSVSSARPFVTGCTGDVTAASTTTRLPRCALTNLQLNLFHCQPDDHRLRELVRSHGQLKTARTSRSSPPKRRRNRTAAAKCWRRTAHRSRGPAGLCRSARKLQHRRRSAPVTSSACRLGWSNTVNRLRHARRPDKITSWYFRRKLTGRHPSLSPARATRPRRPIRRRLWRYGVTNNFSGVEPGGISGRHFKPIGRSADSAGSCVDGRRSDIA